MTEQLILQEEYPYAVGGLPFCLNKQPKFWTWCQRKGYEVKDLEKFAPKDKLKLILRWKWFTDDDTSAKECEEARRDILKRFTTQPPTDEGTKHWFTNVLYVESEANTIKAFFGLISQTEFNSLKNS